MQSKHAPPVGSAPLAGCRVVERSRTVAAAWAGRLLAAMGAQVVMLEPEEGSPLRSAPPLLAAPAEGGESALFAYLGAGKRSRICDPRSASGQALMQGLLGQADILIDDTPVNARAAAGLTPEAITAGFPQLIFTSVLPFGASGPKADWQAEEINLIHAAGEGYLLPNGLSNELFPQRPPLKIYGHFAGYQGGSTAAMCALAAWWAAPRQGGQFVDVSVQDATLAVGAFALQRLGDGSLEHRTSRRFRYGGVFKTRDAYLELLTLEDRQWNSLVELLGRPAWAQDEAWRDPLERSRRGDEINAHIRTWMAQHLVDDIVQRAQALGVPAAKYRTPEEVVNGEHERARGLFAEVTLQNGCSADLLVAPFQFRCSPFAGHLAVPRLGEMTEETMT